MIRGLARELARSVVIEPSNHPVSITLRGGEYAIIDSDDLALVIRPDLRWQATKPNAAGIQYVEARIGPRRIFLHRMLLNPPEHIEVDHINGDGLDCRRSNLRLASHTDNMRNRNKTQRATSSRFKGVSWHRRDQRWRAAIGVNGAKIALGSFTNEVDAARAYNEAATRHFGEFASLNDLPAAVS